MVSTRGQPNVSPCPSSLQGRQTPPLALPRKPEGATVLGAVQTQTRPSSSAAPLCGGSSTPEAGPETPKEKWAAALGRRQRVVPSLGL